MSKKIAIITPTFPPYAGGIGNVAAYHAQQLQRLGYAPQIFTPEYKKLPSEEVRDVAVKRIPPLFTYGNAAFVPSLSWMLEGFDVLHIHYPFFGGTEPIWLHRRKFKKRFNTKIVLHYHMDVVGTSTKHLVFSLHRFFFLKKFLAMADRVLLTSLDYGKHSDIAQTLASTPSKFIAVPNGVDTLHFQPQARNSDVQRKHGIAPTDKVILFVGGLDKAHYFKGIEYLLQAATRLRTASYNWKLVLVGQGDLLHTYASLAEQLNIRNRVIFAGYVPNPQLPAYYNLADVVVLPSVDKSEAFGMVLVEAMACGKPIIASNLPGVRTVVDEGINGFVFAPRDAQDLANKINHVIVHPELAAELGRNGERTARLKYDWKQVGYRLDEVYRSL